MHGAFCMLRKQFLDFDIVHELTLRQAQDLEGLLLRDEASLDSQALLRDLLAAHIGVFCSEGFIVLFIEIGLYLSESLLGRQRSNIFNIIIFFHRLALVLVLLVYLIILG